MGTIDLLESETDYIVTRIPIWLFASIYACGITAAFAESTASIDTVYLVRFPKSANQFVASKLIEEIYRKSGLIAKVGTMPPKRATHEALAGWIDGEVSRIENYFMENPGLIRVTPPFSHIRISAFSTLPISIKSKDDLSKYKIGIVRGVQTSIDLTTGLSNVQEAVNSKALFAMLGAGRFDVAIDVDVNGQFAINVLGVAKARDVGTLLKTEVFTVLAPGRAALKEKLSATIEKMGSSGELDRLKRKYEADFVKSGIEPD